MAKTLPTDRRRTRNRSIRQVIQSIDLFWCHVLHLTLQVSAGTVCNSLIGPCSSPTRDPVALAGMYRWIRGDARLLQIAPVVNIIILLAFASLSIPFAVDLPLNKIVEVGRHSHQRDLNDPHISRVQCQFVMQFDRNGIGMVHMQNVSGPRTSAAW